MRSDTIMGYINRDAYGKRHYINTVMLELLLAFLGVAISHCLNIVFGSFTDILPYLFPCLVCSPSCYFRKLACHPHHHTL